MNKRDLDLHALAEEVVKEMRSETMGRRIEWIVGRLPQAYGDRTTLRQVLVNLVDNAMKYTREEQHARIEIGTVSGEEGEVVVFVRDDGAGFDMRYAHNLFGVFQRLHHAERFEGTGVGLASVRQTVHRHHGHVWAEGKVDEGATFYFSLPVAGLSEPEYH